MFALNKFSSDIALSLSLMDKKEECLGMYGDRIGLSSSLSERSLSEHNESVKKNDINAYF